MSAPGSIAGALLLGAIAAIALAVSLSAGPDSADALSTAMPLRCVTGAAARNPTEPNAVHPGQTITLPTNETFTSVLDAEAFICLRVPYPRDTGDWTLVGVRAERSHSLAQFVDGKGYRAIEMFYRNATTRTQFSLRVQPGAPGTIEGSGPPQPFSIGDIAGSLRSRSQNSLGPAVFTLDWQQNGFWFMVLGGGSLRAQDLLPLLESIR